MSDISTGQVYAGNGVVNAANLNQIISLATINSSFVLGKSVNTTIQPSDSILMAQSGGSMVRITGQNFADGLVNAEPNYARNAVGTLSPYISTMNGDMQIQQRLGTTWTSLGNSSAVYGCDRFKFESSALTGRVTISQNAIELVQTAFYPHTKYSFRVAVTTSQGSLSVTDFATVSQKIERQFARVLFDGVHSLGVVLKSSIAGTYCVSIRNNPTGTPTESYVMECVIATPAVPQLFTFPSLPTMPTASGVWGTLDTDAAYEISVCLGAGSNFQTSPSSWTSGNFPATSNQVNLLGTNGATLDITLLQHEQGSICTPFVWTPFDQSLLRCQRYFFKSFEYGTAIGTASTPPGYFSASGDLSTTVAYSNCNFPVSLRIAPSYSATIGSASVWSYSPVSGVINSIRNINTSSDIALSSLTPSSTKVSAFVASSGFTAGGTITSHLVADVDF